MVDSEEEREEGEEAGDGGCWCGCAGRLVEDDVEMDRPDRLEWRRTSRLELMAAGDWLCAGWAASRPRQGRHTVDDGHQGDNTATSAVVWGRWVAAAYVE